MTNGRRRPRGGHRGLRLLVAVMFAVSGAAALIDEVAWSRWLTLAVGSGAQAAVIVLGSFMGGLGLGSWLAGRVGDARPQLGLKLFAALEGLVGLWSLATIPLLGSWLPEWAAALARAQGTPALPWWMRALLAASLLILPTMLMGATLPLLGRWALTTGGLPGRDIGLLYTLNTLGGAGGALLAAFALIGRLGLARSVLVAGLLDIGVAVVAGLVAYGAARAPSLDAAAPGEPRGGKGSKRKGKKKQKGPVPEPEPAAPDPASVAPAPLVAAVAGFFVSGAVGLALEVTAHRVLSILAGSSSYAFAVMLAAFLIGIALGSLAAAPLADRLSHPGALLAISLGGLAAGTAFARFVFDAGWWKMAGAVAGAVPGLSSWSYGLEMAGSLVALLPATLMLGAAVPVIGRLAGLAPGRFAHRFGLAYALNTVGAVTGTALAGLVLVPRLGTAGTFTVLTVTAGLAGLAIVPAAVPRGARLVPAGAVAVLLAGGLLLGRGADPVREEIASRARGHELLAFDEGPVQTIAVTREFNDQHLGYLRLSTNQTSLTGTHLYAQRYMRLLGHLPSLWNDSPRRALVICLGTGMTAAAVAAHQETEAIDIVEISPEVVGVAPLFREVSGGVLDDPRVTLHVEDGRHVLLAGREPWDLITLEPPPPRDSGVVSLYSTDFYELARERLTENGVLAQWVPLHSQSAEEVRMLVRSFVDVFPHVLGFLPVERDLLMLGADRPLVVDEARLAARMRPEAVRRSLSRLGFAGAGDLLATAVLDKDALARFAGDADLVTDDRPRVEYFARYGKRPGLPPAEPLLSDPLPLASLVAGAPSAELERRFGTARRALTALLGAAWAAERGDERGRRRLEQEALRARPDDPFALWATGLSDEHIGWLIGEARKGGGRAEVWRRAGYKLVLRGAYERAVKAYHEAYTLDPTDPTTLIEYGDLLLGPGGQPLAGRRMLEEALSRLGPGHPHARAVSERLRRAGPAPAGGR